MHKTNNSPIFMVLTECNIHVIIILSQTSKGIEVARIDIKEALRLKERGKTYAEIAKELDCSVAWCKANLRGKHRKKAKGRPQSLTARRRTVRDFPMPKEHYVYCAVIGQDVVYVGKGFRYRYEHINSGTSGKYELNLLHFHGVVFNVFILYEGLSEDEAYKKESEEIRRIQPIYNQQKKVIHRH